MPNKIDEKTKNSSMEHIGTRRVLPHTNPITILNLDYYRWCRWFRFYQQLNNFEPNRTYQDRMNNFKFPSFLYTTMFCGAEFEMKYVILCYHQNESPTYCFVYHRIHDTIIHSVVNMKCWCYCDDGNWLIYVVYTSILSFSIVFTSKQRSQKPIYLTRRMPCPSRCSLLTELSWCCVAEAEWILFSLFAHYIQTENSFRLL